jgi:undecaprenyl-diphosphatase
MIPGVSRSGATILGAMSFGVDRKTAAEFSFFLAMPTLSGATVYYLAKHHDQIPEGMYGNILIGSAVSFIVALVVVKAFVGFVDAVRIRTLRLVPDRRRYGGPRVARPALNTTDVHLRLSC